MKNKLVKTRNAEIQIDEQGIYHHFYEKDTKLTFEDTLEESRMYYASKEAEKIYKAAALLVGSQTSRVLGNFFIGLNKPAMSVKLFTSETEAMKWLMDFSN